MAQIKAYEVAPWVKKPDMKIPIVLLYGPDRGLVSEHARTFAKSTKLPLDDPFTVTRFEAGELDSDPGKLIDEAHSAAMFADQRLIWISNAAGQKSLANSIKTLIEQPPQEAIILVEAGDLKKSATSLRGIVEKAKNAIALPCYSDSARDVETIINETLTNAKLSITLDARQLLKNSLGADRLASRGELEKLVHYCHGAERVTIEDVYASISDAAAVSFDDAIDAVLIGNLVGFDRAFTRLSEINSDPFLVLATATRNFLQIQTLRYDMELNRKTSPTVVNTARPPIFFSRKKLVEQALNQWSLRTLARALERIQKTVLETRQSPELAISATRQCLLALAIEAKRHR